jgi:hypothetical protein
MESVDVQHKVKKTRENTFGNTPEVQEVKEVSKKEESSALQSIQDAVAKKKNAAKPDTEAKAPEVKLSKGFTVGIDENGLARLVPFGSPNFLELVGLMRYTSKKENDILCDLANSKETQVQREINQAKQDLNIVAQGVNSLLDN